MTAMEEQDVALKLLHTADWHLGMRFPAFDELDEPKLTRSRLDVVDRLLDLAEQHAVDAMLCAGDLFDKPIPEPEWWNGLARLFSQRRWSAGPVFLLPGNHDPLFSTSIYDSEHAFRRALPDWVHVVDADHYTYPLNDDAVIYAVPCRSQAGQDDPALSLPERAPGDERFRIGLVHGQTFDIPGCQTNFPIAKDAAEQRGLDYLAIGDTHRYRLVSPGDKAPMVYSGAPEPTKFTETDAGFAALVFFPRRGSRPVIRKERVAQWTWMQETCTGMDSLRALRDREDLRQHVLRLTLRMVVSLPEYEEIEAILKELKGTTASHGRVGVMQIDKSGVKLDTSNVGDLEEELPAVLLSVLERLRSAATKHNPAVAERAICHLYTMVRQARRP